MWIVTPTCLFPLSVFTPANPTSNSISKLWACVCVAHGLSFTFVGVVYFVLFDFSFKTCKIHILFPRGLSFQFCISVVSFVKTLGRCWKGQRNGNKTTVFMTVIVIITACTRTCPPSSVVSHDVLLIRANEAAGARHLRGISSAGDFYFFCFASVFIMVIGFLVWSLFRKAHWVEFMPYSLCPVLVPRLYRHHKVIGVTHIFPNVLEQSD